MNGTARGGGRATPLLARALADPALASGAILGCAIGGLLLQASQPLGHDLGWLLLAARRLLEGAEVYGRDVFEWNPPANLQLLLPPAALGLALPITATSAVRLYIALLAGASLWLCDAALAGLLGRDRRALRRQLLAVAGFALFVFVEQSFGQREHWIAILVLPELCVVAGWAAGRPPARGVALIAGAGAALAVSLKPQYLVLLVLLEIHLALRLRSVCAWRRPDFLALVAMAALQLGCVIVLTPGYLETVVPIARDSYWVYQTGLGELVRWSDLVLLGLAAALLPLLRGRPALLELGAVLGVAAAACYGVFLLQRTGWPYHRLPFELLLLLCFALPLLRLAEARAAAAGLARPAASLRAGGGSLLVLVLLLAAPTRYGETFREGAAWRSGESRGQVALLEQLFREHAAGGWVYVVSPSLVSVFPAVNRAEVGWTSRFSAFYLPAVVARQRRGDPAVPDRIDARRADELERFLREAVLEDLRRRPPRLILIDRVRRRKVFAGVPFDLRAYLLEDPRFAEIWAGYEPLPRVGRFEVARRR